MKKHFWVHNHKNATNEEEKILEAVKLCFNFVYF